MRNLKHFKPFLAETAELDNLVYPIAGSPKLDGVRCEMLDGKAYSRKLELIPNKFIQSHLAGLHGIEGELMLGTGDFNDVQSAVMSVEGKPEFTFHVFDNFLHDESYMNRVRRMKGVPFIHPRIHLVIPTLLFNRAQVDVYYSNCLAEGYEGIILRSPVGRYKFGRATLSEGTYLRVKPWTDDEGTLVDFTEKLHNTNEKELDALGNTKRSSHKDNKRGANTAGGCIVSWKGEEVRLGFGKGITDEMKQHWWDTREDLKGSVVTFTFQGLTNSGCPRFGKLKGFRPEYDRRGVK